MCIGCLAFFLLFQKSVPSSHLSTGEAVSERPRVETKLSDGEKLNDDVGKSATVKGVHIVEATSASTPAATVITTLKSKWAVPPSTNSNDGNRLKLLVFVLTAPKAKVLRDGIRETWVSLAPEVATVTVRFAIGRITDSEIEKELEAEQQLHGDIHRTESDEGYMQISAKVLRFIAESVELGYVFDYIIKADDDTWLQLDVLAQELLTKPRKKFYWGNIYTNNPRFKNPSDLWYEPNYFSDHYPSYATGGTGYVLSADLAQWIARNKDDFVIFTGNEDAMVGTWCAAHRGVPAVHDHRFIQVYGTEQCMDIPLGVHMGPYPVKWPHGTIAATMREYLHNYRASGSVCERGNPAASQRMIAMMDLKDGATWYRIASFSSGECLTVQQGRVRWGGCSQYAAQQKEQQFRMEHTGAGWTLAPRLAAGQCIVPSHSSIALASCSAPAWKEMPPSTGTPGVMKSDQGKCITQHSNQHRQPVLHSCVT